MSTIEELQKEIPHALSSLFCQKVKIIRLSFIITNLLFHLGFIKQIHIIPLGFIRKDNNFLCASKKMSTFAPKITNNKNLCI